VRAKISGWSPLLQPVFGHMKIGATVNEDHRRSERRTAPKHRVVARLVPAALLLFALVLALGSCTEFQDTTDTTTRRTTRTTAGEGASQPPQQQDRQDDGEVDDVRQGRSETTLALDDELISPAARVAEAVGPSVVNVRVEGTISDFFGQQRQQPLGQGSGVVFTSDGYIVTNNHVVSDQTGRPADTVIVTLATGEEMRAEIVGLDPLMDLAVIRVQGRDLPAATFLEDLSELRVGDYAIAIGSPLGFQGSVTMGVISGVQREIEFAGTGADFSLVDLIQTDAAISPGNSGGALVDAQGRVIGINVAYLPPGMTGAQNVGFAIPADVAVDTVEQIVETGQARHSYLGVDSSPVTPEAQQRFGLSRDRGVLVARVYAGSPAQQAGLRQGDIIIEMKGEAVEGQADLYRLLRRSQVGEQVELKIDREGREETVQLTLGERPQ
jgi:S1-C subfamily serine protease